MWNTMLLFYITLSFILQFQSSLQGPVQKSKLCETPECKRAAQNLLDSVDFKKDPCTDFYTFACGMWPKKHKNKQLLIPNSTLLIRKTENDKELLKFLTKNNTDDEPKTVHKTRKLFSMCLDTNSMFAKGVKPIKKLLHECGLSAEPPLNPNSKINLPTTLVKVYKMFGINPFFELVPQPDIFDDFHNILTLSPSTGEDQALPLKKNTDSSASSAEGQETKEIWEYMCANVTSENCDTLRQATGKLWNYIYKPYKEYETKLSQVQDVQYSDTEDAGYNVLSLQELQELTDNLVENVKTVTPTFNWTLYVSKLFEDIKEVSLDFTKPKDIKIAALDINFVKDLVVFLHTNTLHLHEIKLWDSIVNKLGPYTDKHIQELSGNVAIDLSDKKNREEVCSEFISEILGMAVSYYYSISPQYMTTKDEITTMVYNIKYALQKLMEETTWMDEKTKKKALQKVKALKPLVAFPSSIKHAADLDDYYKDLEITNNFLDTLIKKAQNQIKKELSILNAVNDINEDKKVVSPTVVNAYYDPQVNSIIIPAGILGPPVYEYGGLRALAYGSVGTILGHEITHGFDNSGSQFNALGNLDNWWEPKTLKKYKNKAKCFADAYGNYSIEFEKIKMKGDSELTLGEDIADNGGFKEALLAYRKFVDMNKEEPLLPSFENYTHEQLFTMAFANVWCENPTILSSLEATLSDHSPNGVRVNGVAQNSEEFAKIWNCAKGTKMNPEEKKCIMW